MAEREFYSELGMKLINFDMRKNGKFVKCADEFGE